MEKHAILPFGAWLKQRRKALDLRRDDRKLESRMP
jgi:hypothetical protein